MGFVRTSQCPRPGDLRVDRTKQLKMSHNEIEVVLGRVHPSSSPRIGELVRLKSGHLPRAFPPLDILFPATLLATGSHPVRLLYLAAGCDTRDGLPYASNSPLLAFRIATQLSLQQTPTSCWCEQSCLPHPLHPAPALVSAQRTYLAPSRHSFALFDSFSSITIPRACVH
jgi:hypothetical protein